MSLKYVIKTEKLGDYLYKAIVQVVDGDNVILDGETLVGCETEQQVYEYAENVFLPDLRRNYPREIESLELPIDSIQSEQEVMPDDSVPV